MNSTQLLSSTSNFPIKRFTIHQINRFTAQHKSLPSQNSSFCCLFFFYTCRSSPSKWKYIKHRSSEDERERDNFINKSTVVVTNISVNLFPFILLLSLFYLFVEIAGQFCESLTPKAMFCWCCRVRLLKNNWPQGVFWGSKTLGKFCLKLMKIRSKVHWKIAQGENLKIDNWNLMI